METIFIAREIKNAIEKGKTVVGLAKNLALQLKLDGKFTNKEMESFLKDCGIN